jgi:zinc D-Ala-D-Ala carboxypeptidase
MIDSKGTHHQIFSSVQSSDVQSYLHKLRLIRQDLGIPAESNLGCKGPTFAENPDIVQAGTDFYGRDLYTAVEALESWRELQSAAKMDGISLIAVSGFRSVQRQQEIILRKLGLGLPLREILKVNAMPGYSQHHTGFAFDLTEQSDCEPLTEAFEGQDAFAWLSQHGAQYGFRLQYPRDNAEGFIYEPWHWALEAVHRFALTDSLM